MTKEEALDYALQSGAEDVNAAAEYLAETFPKSIDDYTKDDFLDGTEPYEYIYLYNDDKFTRDRLVNKISERAKSVGVKNFPTLFKAFLTTKSAAIAADCGNITDFPDQPLRLRCGKWLCDERGVRTETTDKGTVYACPHPIMPVARMRNIDTGIEKIKIAFRRGRGWQTAIFDRKTLSNVSRITDIASTGIAVTSDTARSLVNYFYDVEQANPDLLPMVECVTHLGWTSVVCETGKSNGFVPYNKGGIEFDGEAEYRARFDAVKMHGSFEEWKAFIDENIRKNKSPAARITFSAALASVLMQPLHCNNFWLHLWGESESAKTVLCMCAASIWGDPTIGRFITTFNSTYVGNEKGAALCGSLPYMLDELQITGKRTDCEQLIYMLMEGAGRSRGNKSGGLDAVARWKNCVISTGEKPINGDNAGGGAVNRVLECECRDYFFEEPRRAAAFVQSNYGFMGKAFVAYLRKAGSVEHAEELLERYSRELAEYEVTQKQAQSAALILTADALACELIFDKDTQLTAEDLLPFLKTKEQVSANSRGYEYLCEQIAANQLHFIQSDKPIEVWGELDGDSVYIIKSVFTRICKDGGFSPAPLLSWLSKNKLIERRGKDMSVVKRIGGVCTRCIHLTMTTDKVDDTDEYPDF